MKPIKISSAQRLDKFLQEKFPKYSRAFIKEQIKLGNFLVHSVKSPLKRGAKQFNRVNDKRVKPFYEMRENDQVVFAPGFVLPDAAAQIMPSPDIKLNIIFEDENVVVINKPAGLSVHPRQDKNGLPLPSEISTTLVSGLLAHYPAIAAVGDNPLLRPGIVHRLDKDTSGVMIIAKNQTGFEWLKKQFKERLANKKYLALVHGALKDKQGEIKTLLARAKNDPTKQKVSQKDGREAITQYKVIKEYSNYSLLEVSPKTGRLHQIRVHLAHLGHPVVGDYKYGDKCLPTLPGLTRPLTPERSDGERDRQFLHAQKLEIALPDGRKKTFLAPLPADLRDILAALA